MGRPASPSTPAAMRWVLCMATMLLSFCLPRGALTTLQVTQTQRDVPLFCKGQDCGEQESVAHTVAGSDVRTCCLEGIVAGSAAPLSFTASLSTPIELANKHACKASAKSSLHPALHGVLCVCTGATGVKCKHVKLCLHCVPHAARCVSRY
jgi:hypothetical protein